MMKTDNQSSVRVSALRRALHAIFAMLAMFAAASCMTTPQASKAKVEEPDDSSYQGDSDQVRGLSIERGFSIERPPLAFDHSLQVRRSKNDVPRELRDGGTVMSGDYIRVSVKASENALLYLAFCTHNGLTMYPAQGGIRARAGEAVIAPEGSEDLVVDANPGHEVLYVILSRRDLALADPRLAEALAATRPSDKPLDYGTTLDAKLAKRASHDSSDNNKRAEFASRNSFTETSMPPSTNVLRGTVVRKEPMSSTHARSDHGPPSSMRAGATDQISDSSDTQHEPAPLEESEPGKVPPDPDFERSPGDIRWYGVDGVAGPRTVVAADADGIAIARYGFKHIASSPPS